MIILQIRKQIFKISVFKTASWVWDLLTLALPEIHQISREIQYKIVEWNIGLKFEQFDLLLQNFSHRLPMNICNVWCFVVLETKRTKDFENNYNIIILLVVWVKQEQPSLIFWKFLVQMNKQFGSFPFYTVLPDCTAIHLG